jgi:hypothetical protein
MAMDQPCRTSQLAGRDANNHSPIGGLLLELYYHQIGKVAISNQYFGGERNHYPFNNN